MSETTITEAATALPGEPRPHLNAALARVQAEMPDVAKGNTATIPPKEGKSGYKYDYADLADCSRAILPLLGKNGLAFSSKPTMNAQGRFILAYALLHESGERDEGEYPLRANSTPQALGGEITYARRYALCAITGLAPGGDDDDAQAAQSEASEARQRGGNDYRRDDSWRDQPPVNRPRPADAGYAPAQGPPERPNNQGPGREVTNGHAAALPAPEPEQPDAVTIAAWGARIDEITCQEDADKADEELKGIFTEGKISPATANAIRGAIKAKAASLGSREESRQPTAEVLAWAQRIEDAADIAALRAVNEEAKTARKLSASYMREGKPVTLSRRIGARRAEIEARMASVPA